MEVWTLSVEADAAVLVVVLYDNIPSVATLIRSTRPDHKDIYSFWCQLAGSSAAAATCCIFVSRLNAEPLIATNIRAYGRTQDSALSAAVCSGPRESKPFGVET